MMLPLVLYTELSRLFCDRCLLESVAQRQNEENLSSMKVMIGTFAIASTNFVESALTPQVSNQPIS